MCDCMEADFEELTLEEEEKVQEPIAVTVPVRKASSKRPTR
jgi:hypothetical protein